MKSVAESGGFEPPVREARTTAFEAAAFDHSANSPSVWPCRSSAIITKVP